MLLEKPRRFVFAGLGFLALSLAPVAYAISLPSPVAQSSHAAHEATDAIAFSSDRVESREHGAVLILTGKVRIEAPLHATIAYGSDRITRRPDGAALLEGGVTMTIEQSRISSDRALVTPSPIGGSVITMDRAEVTQINRVDGGLAAP
jgi:hypothetical protein